MAGIPFCYWRGLGLLPGFVDLAIMNGGLAKVAWIPFLIFGFPCSDFNNIPVRT